MVLRSGKSCPGSTIGNPALSTIVPRIRTNPPALEHSACSASNHQDMPSDSLPRMVPLPTIAGHDVIAIALQPTAKKCGNDLIPGKPSRAFPPQHQGHASVTWRAASKRDGVSRSGGDQAPRGSAQVMVGKPKVTLPVATRSRGSGPFGQNFGLRCPGALYAGGRGYHGLLVYDPAGLGARRAVPAARPQRGTAPGDRPGLTAAKRRSEQRIRADLQPGGRIPFEG
jgi:hypothetical protein